MVRKTVYSSLEAILAFVGTATAGTLYWAHRSGVELPCTTGGGCDLVYASHWATFHGLPIALLGLAAYIILLFASIIKGTSNDYRFESALNASIVVLTAGGTAYSWYLQYVSSVFIGAFCIYCRTSAITMTLLFIVGVVERFSYKRFSATAEIVNGQTTKKL